MTTGALAMLAGIDEQIGFNGRDCGIKLAQHHLIVRMIGGLYHNSVMASNIWLPLERGDNLNLLTLPINLS
jgi:hypothetical protein